MPLGNSVCLCLMLHQQLRPYGDGAKVSSDKLEKPGIEPATPGLQGEPLYTLNTVEGDPTWI